MSTLENPIQQRRGAADAASSGATLPTVAPKLPRPRGATVTDSPVAQLVTVAAVARAAGVSVITIHRWIEQGILPQPIRFGHRTLRFRAEEINAWFAANVNHPIGEICNAPHPA